jgi:hypothetical protein
MRPGEGLGHYRFEKYLPQERVIDAAVASVIKELLKGPPDIGPAGKASALRSGIIPGLNPVSDDIWNMKPTSKKRTLAHAAGLAIDVYEFALRGKRLNVCGVATPPRKTLIDG